MMVVSTVAESFRNHGRLHTLFFFLEDETDRQKAFMERGLRFRPETVAFGPRIRDF